MAKLILTHEGRRLQACVVAARPVSIGRLSDNDLVIDNPAVSGHHARVYRETTHYVLEDLKSTNGTFVNDKPIARHTLRDGDTVLIGMHTLTFTHTGDEEHVSGGLEHGRPSQVYDAVVPKTAIPTLLGHVGTLKVLAGHASRSEFVLAAVTTLIGKSESAQIRLTGWFKPKFAAAIARKSEGFTISPMGAKVMVNGERVTTRRPLASGDVIDVAGLSLEFTLS
ncbi:MAG TPA: FHA domain-containing protein [Vicinamibacterales bacterium]|nr:FHA domain-containing protein [Vicinamibacterales bacterium]